MISKKSKERVLTTILQILKDNSNTPHLAPYWRCLINQHLPSRYRIKSTQETHRKFKTLETQGHPIHKCVIKTPSTMEAYIYKEEKK